MPIYEPKTELEMNLDRLKHDKNLLIEELEEINQLIEKYENALKFFKEVEQ